MSLSLSLSRACFPPLKVDSVVMRTRLRSFLQRLFAEGPFTRTESVVGVVQASTSLVGGSISLQNFNLDLRIRAIARSQKMLLGERRIDIANWEKDFESSAIDVDLAVFEQHLNPDHLPHAVIIDCTASDQISAKYAEWLARGIHVITPNKKAFSSFYGDYQALQDAADEGSSHYFYETTVGAGLPVISTLCDLIHTGDEVRSIRGIFSGTLAYLFNVYDGTTPFSEIVRIAKESGYTEPDPRDDLSGMGFGKDGQHPRDFFQ